MNKYFKKATYDNCDLLFRWKNDKASRENSFNSLEVKYEDHVNWLKEKLDSEIYSILIFYIDNIPIGVVRSEFLHTDVIISYSIDEQWRGHGLAKDMLILFEKEIDPSFNKIIGYVKYTNIKSQKIFEKLGYEKRELNDKIQYSKLL